MAFNIAQFSNDKLNESKPFFVVLPDGTKTEGKIYIYSMKSKKAINALDDISNDELKSQKYPMRRAVNKDIKLCSKLVDKIENILISDNDNTSFGFEVENGAIISNNKNIKILIENFPFIRDQIAKHANNDALFYELVN